MTKRLLDIIVSSVGLALLSPLLLLTALGIKISSPGPVFYRAKRVGFDEKPFLMYKFRTMIAQADKIGGPTTSNDDPRITSVGKIIRKWRIDEMPQLINVLKGDMSLVGPRPEVEEVTRLFTKEQKFVFTVRPGMTDWASLKFLDEGEIVKRGSDPHRVYLEKIWPEKIRLQMKYVKERSFWTDIKIILQTIKKVFLNPKSKMKNPKPQLKTKN